MRIAGRNSTTPQSRQNVTSTKPSIFEDAWSKVTKHFSENWVSMLFNAAKFLLTQVLFFGIGWVIYNIWELKQNYATLEERSKNAQSSLINEANCKNNVLVDCYGKCTLRQVVEKQHACEPIK